MNNMPPPQIGISYSTGALSNAGFLSAEITIPQSWHVNANIAVDDFLKPSEIEARAEGIHFGKAKWPTPKKDYNESLDLENLIFEGTFRVEIPIEKIESFYDSLSTKVLFRYQACSRSICLAPNAVEATLDNNRKGSFAIFSSQLNDQKSERVLEEGSNASKEGKKSSEQKSLKQNPASISPQNPLENPAGASSQPSSQPAGLPAQLSSENPAEISPQNSLETPAGVPASASPQTSAEFSQQTSPQTSAEFSQQTSPQISAEFSQQTSPQTPSKTKALQETAPKQKSKESLFLLLFFAFLGGVILNFMPCVLPVLSLKLMALIRQAKESRARLLALGLSTTIGILASLWVLASAVLILRANGGNPGWGMQFQSPEFLAAMVSILALFAMSFLGAFEVFLPGETLTKMDGASKREGLSGAFFTGALLVFLSTPCSAPFLGPAMGFAFSETSSVLFLFFTAAGLGLSLPYLLISLCPRLLQFLPKPGAWMVKLQKGMGILLLLSIVWIFWLGARAFGTFGFGFLFSIGVLNILFALLLGKLAPPGKPFWREALAFTFIILLNAIIIWKISPQLEKALPKETIGWVNYSKENLEKARLEGKIVFLDVTADWCLTCKANEAVVLSNDSLEKFFQSNKILKMKADWTHADEKITELLYSLGRSGVPTYAVYSPEENASPIVLSEILSQNLIENTIRKILENESKFEPKF